MFSLNWPTEGKISSKFGLRVKPKVGWHSGLDIANIIGTPVRAAYRGNVIFFGNRGKYGNAVIIHHPSLGDVWTLYGHLSTFMISKFLVDSYIRQGDVIGEIGNTGWSTGPHLHFEVRVGFNGILAAKNPLKYLS